MNTDWQPAPMNETFCQIQIKMLTMESKLWVDFITSKACYSIKINGALGEGR